MLALPEPFGFGQGIAISIRAPNERWFEIGEVVASYGCPYVTVKRVRNCILYSGRYDCSVSPSVAHAFRMLQLEIGLCGGEVLVNPTNSYDYRVTLQRAMGLEEAINYRLKCDRGCSCNSCIKKLAKINKLREIGVIAAIRPALGIAPSSDNKQGKVVNEVKKLQEQIAQTFSLKLEGLKMKHYKPKSGDIRSWLNDETNATPLTGKSDIVSTLQKGEQYPAFLQGDKLVCATNEEESRQLASEAGPNSEFFAVDRDIIDTEGTKGSGGQNV
jgi:hypothetical protein